MSSFSSFGRQGDVAFITTGEKMKLSKESRVSHMIAFADSIDVPVPGTAYLCCLHL